MCLHTYVRRSFEIWTNSTSLLACLGIFTTCVRPILRDEDFDMSNNAFDASGGCATALVHTYLYAPLR